MQRRVDPLQGIGEFLGQRLAAENRERRHQGRPLAQELPAGPGHQAEDPEFMAAKVITARFYAEHILPRTAGLRDAIVDGAGSVTAMALESF